jgi:Family of unknown function (DUF6519)
MAGDYSRKRFNPENHYQGVLRQQGRVDLDADWNEYVDLQDRRWRAETTDGVGRCGVPSETPDGFKIQGAVTDLTLGQGRIYVEGLLAENHGAQRQFNAKLEENYGTAGLPLNEQPYRAGDLTVPAGTRALVYLDVWRREVTHLQDPGLIEPAVNVDTTTRYQTVWQVKLLNDIATDVTCQTELADLTDWPAQNLPSVARLTTSIVAVSSESDLSCLVPPTGGYRGLENHLYRVEVHDVGSSGEVRVKWSRENAHVATNVLQILDGLGGVKVESLGRDDVLRFKPDDWVEITNDPCEFLGKAGIMRRISTVDDANQTLTFSEALPTTDFQAGSVAVVEHWRVIRWDQSGSGLTSDGLIELSAANPSFVLEYGIQVELTVLAGGSAHAGDYWCFAARTADADIEPLDQAPPLGIHHHFCKLAIIDSNGVIQDCRPVFPALTELTSLFYVSGDGQEALPGDVLPKPIQVGVANGKRPVAGAWVRFSVADENGNLTAGTQSASDLILTTTDSQGIASCNWTLDMANLSQQAEAQLADGSHLPVRFNAALSQAGGIDPGIHVQRILIANAPLRNDSEVMVPQLVNGIRFECDGNLFQASVLDKPVCRVTLDIPFPYNSVDQALWGSDIIGFQPLVLAADVDIDKQTITWRPKLETSGWLQTLLFQKLPKVDRVLARLTLKGSFIWEEQDPDVYVYLDGDVFGIQAAGSSNTDVKLPSGDGRRGGDLEMWFWLAAVRVAIRPPVARLGLGEEVDFTVTVEGTANKAVEMSRVPPNAGSLERSSAREDAWTYTAPRLPGINHVSITAKSLADTNRWNTAQVFIRQPGEIAVSIEVPQPELAVNDKMDLTVTVEGGDVTKIEMSVNGVLNGGPLMGTLEHKTRNGLGVWTYTAPDNVPFQDFVTITATSQEDTTKWADAKVRITESKLQGPAGSTNPATGDAGGSGGTRVRRSTPGSSGSSTRRSRKPRS